MTHILQNARRSVVPRHEARTPLRSACAGKGSSLRCWRKSSGSWFSRYRSGQSEPVHDVIRGIRRERLGLILADISLPVMDAIAALGLIDGGRSCDVTLVTLTARPQRRGTASDSSRRSSTAL